MLKNETILLRTKTDYQSELTLVCYRATYRRLSRTNGNFQNCFKNTHYSARQAEFQMEAVL